VDLEQRPRQCGEEKKSTQGRMQEQKGITLLEENHRVRCHHLRCRRKTTVSVAGGERSFNGGRVELAGRRRSRRRSAREGPRSGRRSPVARGSRTGMEASQPCRRLSVARREQAEDFLPDVSDQWMDLPGKRVERPGSTSLVDSQTSRWPVPGQFGPWFVRPGEKAGFPSGSLKTKQALSG
jgi:hypothetical protein